MYLLAFTKPVTISQGFFTRSVFENTDWENIQDPVDSKQALMFVSIWNNLSLDRS